MVESAPDTITLLQAITLAIAFVGAVLGIINTWHAIDKSRVKLKVRPAHAIPYGSASSRIEFAIEVTNLSAFPVTIRDVGVFVMGRKHRIAYGGADGLMNDGLWPKRLEPRSSVTVYGGNPAKQSSNINCAYAITECGVTSTGTSAALKQIIREASSRG